MVPKDWKHVSKMLFIVAGLTFFFYFFISILFASVYASYEVIRRESDRKAREALLVLVSIGILIVGGIISHFKGKEQDKSALPKGE
ncbi:hypothetical protein HY991_05105 [Candidatus Micrarchaeota archaeon]|nr:hypothetical protein [Candidatus Micrarchaeota archaeon]